MPERRERKKQHHVNEDQESEMMAKAREVPQLQPERAVGTCPECGGPLVENAYWLRSNTRQRDGLPLPLGVGEWVAWRECWNALGAPERRTCSYRISIPFHPGLLR